ncbi:MAG: ACP synthase, partial [Halobacteriales archaeon]
MSEPAIAGVGGYAPAGRLAAEAIADAWDGTGPRGVESVAVPAADEDALTMAWEAGRRALEVAAVDPADVAWLGLATTTPPLAEGDVVARLASTLGVDPRTGQDLLTGSTCAGTRAVCRGLETGPWPDGVGLAIAADAPEGHPADDRGRVAGAGAAAVVLGDDGPGRVGAQGHEGATAPGVRFRRRGSTAVEGLGITTYD